MVIELPTFGDIETGGMQRKGPFTDIDEFLNAVEDAQAGDLIILADGNYDISGKEIEVENRIGTATQGIIVKPETVGGAILEGSQAAARFRFQDCRYFTWYGFKHMHKAPTEEDNIVFRGGNNNRFARCEVKLDNEDPEDPHDKRHWLQISNCKAMRVDHCFFHHKKSKGQFCNVKFGSDNDPGEGAIFEYNYFLHQDYNEIAGDDNIGDAGGEGIQMGDSAHASRYYRAIVRYNCFEECNGDGEIVTNKSCGNLYYNNTFTNSNGSLTLRHGHSTAVLANYFKNCGLRVCGANNLIANNHFTDNSRSGNRRPLVIHNGKEEGSYERVINNHIILNTFANGSGTANEIVVWGSGNGSREPRNNKFRGNIISGENGMLLKLNNNHPSNTITDNIGWITRNEAYGDLLTQMATRVNPLLTRDGDGIYRLQSGSPARNKFQGTPFKELTDVDIDGKERGPNTDAGCHQYSTESKRPKKRITPEDVGPKATTDLGDSPDWNPEPVNPQD